MLAMLMLALAASAAAANISNRHETRSNHKIKENASAERRMAAAQHSRATHAAVQAGHRGRSTRSERATHSERTTRTARASHGAVLSRVNVRTGHRLHATTRIVTSPVVDDPAAGDIVTGEDPVVREAAVHALGNMNGTVVVIDPASGRILAMVNQKLALASGAQPCSTIKVSVALAALSEGVVTRDTPVNLGGWSMDMDHALAHSNNQYFEALGRHLGFARVSHYARLFGLGELAGWNIAGEHLGVYPDEELPSSQGGVGKMCSFGESISMTPLQLGSLMSALANGGTLYYLQHPRNLEEIVNFQPRVKRYLDIAPLIPEIGVGMLGATEYGTARSLRTSFTSEPVLGKTGTCSSSGTRFGWFGSYTNAPSGRIVTVVFLRGDRSVFGPRAAELAGRFYHELEEHNYFAGRTQTVHSAALQR